MKKSPSKKFMLAGLALLVIAGGVLYSNGSALQGKFSASPSAYDSEGINLGALKCKGTVHYSAYSGQNVGDMTLEELYELGSDDLDSSLYSCKYKITLGEDTAFLNEYSSGVYEFDGGDIKKMVFTKDNAGDTGDWGYIGIMDGKAYGAAIMQTSDENGDEYEVKTGKVTAGEELIMVEVSL